MPARWRDAVRVRLGGPGAWRLRRDVVYHAWSLLRPLAAHHRGRLRGTRVVAVVGSLGKTTTARAVATALGLEPPDPYASNQFGFLALRLLGVRRDARHAVLEAGLSGPGQMAAYARLLRPDVVVVTAIASEHGTSFGSLEATRTEKVRMVEALPAGGLAVLNADDEHARWMASRTRARVVTFGERADADVRIVERRTLGAAGSELDIEVGGRRLVLRTRLLGRPAALALAAAVAVADAEGVEATATLQRLAGLAPTAGRLEAVPLPSGAVAIRDDFKSPEEGVREALELLAEMPARRRVVLLGDVTEPRHQGQVYRALGTIAGRAADRVVTVGHAGQRWGAAATAAGLSPEAVQRGGSDPETAARRLEQELGPGDVLLVTGREVQRLGRVVLALAGEPVRCWIPTCRARSLSCRRCARLRVGWGGGRR